MRVIKLKTTMLTLVILLAVISIPLDTNRVKAEGKPGDLSWVKVETPSREGNMVISPSEVNRICIGSDGKTFYALDSANGEISTGKKALYRSLDGGTTWMDKPGVYLKNAGAKLPVWDIAVAPDNPKILVAVTDRGPGNSPGAIWISGDGGATWADTHFPVTPLYIGSLSISAAKGKNNLIAAGTRNPSDGTASGEIYLVETGYITNWTPLGFGGGDVLSIKFSPAFPSDPTLMIVNANSSDTLVSLAMVDTTGFSAIFNRASGFPVKLAVAPLDSPGEAGVVSADIELPTDFAGQFPAQTRFFVSYDAPGTAAAGIYRIESGQISFMPVPPGSSEVKDRISSISYTGNAHSGKLLAGTVNGVMCRASVPVFTNLNPWECRGSCWQISEKPPTGGAGSPSCGYESYGNAVLVWDNEGKYVYCGTSSARFRLAQDWPLGFLTSVASDESAFSVSRDNGHAFSQLSLIDTVISSLAEIAPAAEGKISYLGTINDSANCTGFDSLWISPNPDLGGEPGNSWERVLCTHSGESFCPGVNKDQPILKLAGNKPDGSTVFLGFKGNRKIFFSADFGTNWETLNPSLPVQDFTPETGETVYVLDENASVQKIKISKTGITYGENVASCLKGAFSIATAYTALTPDNPPNHVLVGGNGQGEYDVAYSSDGGLTFKRIPSLPFRGNVLVIASSSYKSDGTINAVVNGGDGIYAWEIYSGKNIWQSWWWTGVVSLEISRNYSYYFASPASAWSGVSIYARWNQVTAGLDPTVEAGTEPNRCLRLSGGLTIEQPVSAWFLDRRDYSPDAGHLWRYVDTLCWLGPSPVSPSSDKRINYDPVTGRQGRMFFSWQQRSLSRRYQLQLAEDDQFTLLLADIGSAYAGPFYTPPVLTSPNLYVPPGGGTITDGDGNTWQVPGTEAGNTYYWRVRTREVATGDIISSPWSWTESFTVSPGLPVKSSYMDGIITPSIIQRADITTQPSATHPEKAPVPRNGNSTANQNQAHRWTFALIVVMATLSAGMIIMVLRS